MATKPLLTGFTVRALAHSALRAGVSPLAVDAFGDRDLLELCPEARGLALAGEPYRPRALEQLARGLHWDGVVYAGALENHPGMVQRLSRGTELLGNPPEVLRQVRNWRRVSRDLAAAGFRVPITLPPGRPAPPQGEWLEKPARGAGGSGVAKAQPGTLPPSGRLIQERLQGPSGSALFVSTGKESRLLGITEQLAARPEFGGQAFQYAGNILLPAPPPGLFSRLEHLCQFLTERYGLVGLGGVDFIIVGGEPVPVEVNPRYTAAMELVEWASGISMFGLQMEACAGRCPPPLPAWASHFGKAILYAKGKGTWHFGGDWRGAGLRDLPWPETSLQAGHPVCTILAEGLGRDRSLQALVQRAMAVRKDWIAAAP